MNLTERVASLIANSDVQVDGCWTFLGRLDKDGYGHTWFDQRDARPHRLTYEAAYGPIPDGLVIDHLCRNRACLRPDHLEAVTTQENTFRSPVSTGSINAAKTHCAHGHEFTPENTYTSTPGWRQCRTCNRERAHKRYVASIQRLT